MTGWHALFGDEFDLDGEAVCERPETFDVAAAALDRMIDAYDDLLVEIALATRPSAQNASGLTIDALVALVDELVHDVRRVPERLREARNALSCHANELDELRSDSDREFGYAVERQLEREAARGLASEARRSAERAERNLHVSQLDPDPSAYGQAAETSRLAEADSAAADRGLAEAEEARTRSLLAYRRLRQLEQELNDRTAAALDEIDLPVKSTAVPAELPADLTDALSTGVVGAWGSLRRVLLASDLNLELPTESSRPVDCVTVDDGGRLSVHVQGPFGGEFVVGREITPELFEVLVALLSGRLPEFRPFHHVNDLSRDETSALAWAYQTNFAAGEGPQMQVGGVNGSWVGYIEGGPWTAQDLWPVDGFEIALTVGPGPLTGSSFVVRELAQLAADGLQAQGADCRSTFVGSRPATGDRRSRNADREGNREDGGEASTKRRGEHDPVKSGG